MTLSQLSQLYHLKREIELDKKRLQYLRTRVASLGSINYNGMPKKPNCENQLERQMAEIIDLEAIIQAKITQCLHARNRLERYIAEIPDSLTRQIFTLRFIEGLTWDNCAARIKGNNTAKNLSNICYRYIQKSKQI